MDKVKLTLYNKCSRGTSQAPVSRYYNYQTAKFALEYKLYS